MKKSKELMCSVSCGGKRPDVCGVYTIVSPGGEVYVGSSGSCYERWTVHGSELRRYVHGSSNLQEIADKYGEHTLVFEVIEELPKALLRQAEQRLIDQLVAEGRVVLNQNPATGGCTRNTCPNPESQPKHCRGTHLKTGEVLEFPSIHEAARSGFDHSAVSRCCNGKRDSHRGYRWEFLD